ncbi:MAG: type II secretion system protein GspG, partial [Pseudomonadota bacterium]
MNLAFRFVLAALALAGAWYLVVTRGSGRFITDYASPTCADARVIAHTLKIFKQDHGVWPTTVAALAEEYEGFGKYLDRPPRDLWGGEYHFSVNRPAGVAVERTVYVWSYGADGQPGGRGVNSDVGNWMYSEDQPWRHRFKTRPMRCLGNWSGELT